MKIVAAVALACGFAAAPMVMAPTASASPGYCDGADCVPYLTRSVAAGEHCNQNTRYNWGLDASGNTLACSSRRVWIEAPPLVGVRTLRLPCGDQTGVAQSPDGVPLSCMGGAWSADYSWTFYK